jgi:hypothetical protein
VFSVIDHGWAGRALKREILRECGGTLCNQN